MEMAAILLVIVVAFGAGCFACRAVHKRVPTRRATDLMSVSDELQTIKRLVASVVNITDRTAMSISNALCGSALKPLNEHAYGIVPRNAGHSKKAI